MRPVKTLTPGDIIVDDETTRSTVRVVSVRPGLRAGHTKLTLTDSPGLWYSQEIPSMAMVEVVA